MATSAQVATSTTAARVNTAAGTPRQLYVRVTATGTVYLGGANVSSSNGLAVADTDGLVGPIVLGASEDLWGVAAAATPTLQTLTTFTS